MLIRAFNLVPGAGFRREGTDLFGHVVTKVSRDIDMETVTVRTHDGLIFAFDFGDEVTFVGLDANLGAVGDDIEDLDLGIDKATDADTDQVVETMVALGFDGDLASTPHGEALQALLYELDAHHRRAIIDLQPGRVERRPLTWRDR